MLPCCNLPMQAQEVAHGSLNPETPMRGCFALCIALLLLACGRRERAEIEVSLGFSLDGGTPEEVHAEDGILHCGYTIWLEWRNNSDTIVVTVTLPEEIQDQTPPVELPLTQTLSLTDMPKGAAHVGVLWNGRRSDGVGRITYVEETHGSGWLAATTHGIDFTDVAAPSDPTEVPPWSGRLTGKLRCVDRLPFEPAGEHEKWDPPSGGGGGGGGD